MGKAKDDDLKVRVDSGMREAMDVVAGAKRTSLSEIARQAILEHLNRLSSGSEIDQAAQAAILRALRGPKRK